MSRLLVPLHDIHRARIQATTHCTSWRSDGSPPCLGESSHRWVPVNTHSTPVPLRREAVGGSAQTHNTRQRQTMSPDLYPLRPVYAIAGKHYRISPFSFFFFFFLFLFSFSFVIVLRFLGLIVVCCGVGEQPAASPPKWARVYCGFLPGPTRVMTHPGRMVIHQSASSCLRVCLCGGCRD